MSWVKEYILLSGGSVRSSGPKCSKLGTGPASIISVDIRLTAASASAPLRAMATAA